VLTGRVHDAAHEDQIGQRLYYNYRFDKLSLDREIAVVSWTTRTRDSGSQSR